MFVRKCYQLSRVAHSDVASQKLPRKQRRRINKLSSSDLQRNVKKQYIQYQIFRSLMSMDGEWGDYIALLGLVNIIDIPVAVVSSLGEEGLNITYPTVSHG